MATVGRGPVWSLLATEQMDGAQVVPELRFAEFCLS